MKNDNGKFTNHSSLSFLNMVKIINWEKLSVNKTISDEIDDYQGDESKVINCTTVFNDISKKYLKEEYTIINATDSTNNATNATDTIIQFTDDESLTQMKTVNETFRKVDAVLKSIGELTEKEGDLSVDNTNLFILSMVNIVAALFTFVLRNFTGNWEIDMNIFFLVNFFSFC